MAHHPQPAIGTPSWKELKGKNMPVTPIKLKLIMKDHGIDAGELAAAVRNKKGDSISRAAIYQAANRMLLPLASTPDFKDQVEAFLRSNGVPDKEIAQAWDPVEDGTVIPFNRRPMTVAAGTTRAVRSINQFSETLKEAEMLTPTTMKHFQLFRNPFLDDVQETGDVFMSESHRYAHAAMMDAAKSGGFVAICGECGAGKSVMRRKLISELNEAGDVRIIQPQTIDKQELTSGHILDSIILDLDPDATPKRTREAKARQVRQALLASSRGGQRHVLIIEEAHDLSVATMKQLKRLWEIEDGYKKVLGIILVGQPELQVRLNRNTHPEMREVILRCLIGTLESLTRDDCERYIDLKFRRLNKDVREVLAADCVDAVMSRLTVRQTGFSSVYPLYINNLLAKAMNQAAQLGEPLVTPEIIEGV